MWDEIAIKGWSETDTDELQSMWKKGKTVREIAEKLNRTPSSVKGYICRNRETLNLKSRINSTGRPRSNNPKFDKEWYGCVPCRHWTITKPWSKVL